MKTVAILTALGILSLIVLSCRGSSSGKGPPPAPAPAPLPAKPDPVILLVDEIEKDVPEKDRGGRVLPYEERRALIHRGMLPQVNPNDQVIEYEFFSRMGPSRHYKIRKTAPAPAPVPTRID